MKIRILIDARQIGGVEIHIMNLCEELCKRSHDCEIFFIRHYSNSILYSICDKKQIHYRSFKSYQELIKCLIQEKPEIIHAHGYKANIFSRLFGLFTRTRIVTTFHSGEKPIGRLIIYNFLDKWSSFLSTNICVNQEIANRLPFNTTVLPNFVDAPKPLNHIKSSPPYQVYFIGRVNSEKGPERFCQLAKQSSQDYEWHMVGDGPLLESCKKNYPNKVHYHGVVENMEEVWPNVDLLCITSTYEGLPLVLLEAMSRGIPVVSFDVGNIKEVANEPGLIVDPYNLERMQEIINALFSQSKEKLHHISKKAVDRILTTYSKNKVVSDIFDIYTG